MANYPNSVTSFTTKNSGDVVAASHINDIQGEVAAVETALLGTITHSVNISGASSLASLSVSGGSTFGARPVMPPPEAVLVQLQANADFGSSAASTLMWLTQTYATNSSIHSSGTNPERLTPQSTGIFRFTAQLAFNGVGTGNAPAYRQLQIADSSGGNIGLAFQKSSEGSYQQVTGYKRFDVAGGYARLIFAGDGGSTNSVAGNVGPGYSWFAMEKL